MKKLIILLLIGLSINSYAQFKFNKTIIKLTLDTLLARDDSIFAKSPFSAKVDLSVRDTGIVDLIKFYAIGDIINLGADGQIPHMNVAGSDFVYSPNFKYKDDTLRLYKNISSTLDTTKVNGVFQVGDNFEWNGSIFVIKDAFNNIYLKDRITPTHTGINNVVTGVGAAYELTSGSGNSINGHSSAHDLTTGSYNTCNGYNSGANLTTGIGNVFIGRSSGKFGNGSYNVFLGGGSGEQETGSNKLYIENSNSATPLIYGEFDNDYLWFNVDTTYNEGDLSISEDLIVSGNIKFTPDHSKLAYKDSAVLITGGTNVQITNVGDSLFSVFETIGITYIKGDTLLINYAGGYNLNVSFRGYGTNGADWNVVYAYKRSGVTYYDGQAIQFTTTGATNRNGGSSVFYNEFEENDKVWLVISRIGGTGDITTTTGCLNLQEYYKK